MYKAKTTSALAEPEARKISLEKRMNPNGDSIELEKDESIRKYLTAHENGRAERTVERRRRL